MACEGCNAKFTFFSRKKQCMDCLRYFCSECVIRRLDKILSCAGCCLLSRRPLIRSLIIQMRTKDIRWYLIAKRVPIKGCIEKEDLIKLLMVYANGRDYYSTENRGHTNIPTDQSATRNSEERSEVSDQTYETNATRTDQNEIPETTPRVNGHECPEQLNVSTIQNSSILNPVKLSEINTSEDLECLSVKQLKNLLSTNRVDYKGCVERCELLKKATTLWEEYKESREKGEIPDENICKICWDEPIECIILECGHMACCLNCGKQMSECPICKQYVVRVVRFFKS
ncbi:E3 ubiquitin-protein ligase RNF34 [Ceratina calcarata]|uniref:E3 ubiquitin-protein ligase RNF34 n=1 Tax=Ceratina calcarata TaxID=156304 RepID=A0AAJ7IYE3_9HYME|nr:E3 ubiquitin-protein ligase RNF34 [Ceratina calcarata]